MQPLDIHFCLLSEQQVANVIPLLHEPFRPDQVVLLVSQAMRDKEPYARRTMQSLGLKVDAWEIDSYNIHAIREQVLKVLTEYEGYSVGLNVTGGTKIMALGAHEAFSADSSNTIFYLDTGNQRILRLFPDYVEFPLPDLLDVRTALRSYGFSVQKAAGNSSLGDPRLTERLANRASYYGKALSRLNYLADRAEEDLTVRLEPRDWRNKPLMELIGLFREQGLLDHDGRSTLGFPDEASRGYVHGGWLEEHVARIVRNLQEKGLVRDREMNLLVNSPSGAENELDVAFTGRNRLHLIECKTVNYQFQQESARGDQAAYKLHSLRQETAGAFGRAMIVSFRQLRLADRQRCRDLNIDTVEAGELANLHARLQDWISR
ncbi:MAG: DUF1887 family protein [Desulfohalobiaceae bacterium]|nr:DUF1887 family protein [Desulfohalobiaceae bacterium]